MMCKTQHRDFWLTFFTFRVCRGHIWLFINPRDEAWGYEDTDKNGRPETFIKFSIVIFFHHDLWLIQL